MPIRAENGESHTKRDMLIVAAFIAATPIISRHVKKIVKNPEDTDDVMQETIYSALKAANNFRGGSQIETWLYRIAHNKALDKVGLRYRTHEEPQAPDSLAQTAYTDVSPEDEIIAREEFEEICRQIATLPVSQQKVMALRLLEFTHREIAEFLDIQESTSKEQMTRGRAEVLKKLDN